MKKNKLNELKKWFKPDCEVSIVLLEQALNIPNSTLRKLVSELRYKYKMYIVVNQVRRTYKWVVKFDENERNKLCKHLEKLYSESELYSYFLRKLSVNKDEK